MMYKVREFNPKYSQDWNNFVVNHPNSCFYHLFEWQKIFKNAYSLKTLYLGCFFNNQLVGILPTAIIEKPFCKPIAVSLPYANYVGYLIDEKYCVDKILNCFLDYLNNQKISYFENRRIDNSEESIYSGEVTIKRKLYAASDQLWEKLDAKVRNQVRKAQKQGLKISWGIDQLEDLYYIYSKNMLNLGTPVHDLSYFKNILEYFKNYVDILIVRLDSKTIGAMLLVKFKNQLSDPIASSLKRYNNLNPNMLMYWEALKYGCDNGFVEFDFGRSHIGSGTYKFKMQWGGLPKNLSYDIYSFDGKNRNTTTDLYRGNKALLVSRIWRQIPYQVSLIIGPKIRKYLP